MRDNTVKIQEQPGWKYFIAEDAPAPTAANGKWMYAFNLEAAAFADDICIKAVKEGACRTAKRTSDADLKLRLLFAETAKEAEKKEKKEEKKSAAVTGMCCFYMDGADEQQHKRLLKFFLENNLIRKNKAGKLYNISFKFDEQTRNGEYGKDFAAEIRLADFVDLTTGEFIR